MRFGTQCLAAALVAGVVAALVGAVGCGHESAASPGRAAQVIRAETPATVAPVAVAPVEATAEPAVAPEAAPPVAAGQPPTAESQTSEPAAQESPAAPVPPKPRGQRPPADRGPARPGEAEKITFDDLNLGMREDMVFRPFLLTDRVRELDGKRLSIIGYMHGGVESRKNVKEFVLLKNTECKFGPGGQADHLAQVYLVPDAATAFTDKPVKVEATLKVQPYEGSDGNTWAIYRLEEAKIVR
jgi:hypothetical protein